MSSVFQRKIAKTQAGGGGLGYGIVVEDRTTAPLDYEMPDSMRKRGVLTRVPVSVLFAIIILPGVAFGQGCRRLMPGERLRADELILPAVGFPVALAVACASFRASSVWRRVGLAVVALISIAGLAGTVMSV
jgi:hypothetical protein